MDVRATRVGAAFELQGTFKASKGRQAQSAANLVQVLIHIWRLPDVHSDVVLTLTTPMHISELSAAAQDVGAGAKTLHTTAPALFFNIIQSLRIMDTRLFGSCIRVVSEGWQPRDGSLSA
jgi:hypothetical protein